MPLQTFNEIIERRRSEMAAHWEQSPDVPYDFPAEDYAEMRAAVLEMEQEEREAAYSAYFERHDEGETPDVSFDDVAAFYAAKILKDAALSTQSAKVNLNTLEKDRNDVVEQSFQRLEHLAENSLAILAAAVAGLAAYEIATRNGWRFYVLNTQLDDRVRLEHARRHGKVFVFGQARVNADIPGVEPNCRCTLREISADEAAGSEFFYPEDRRFLPEAMNKKLITIENRAGTHTLIGAIGYDVTAANLIDEIGKAVTEESEIELIIDSEGGSVDEGKTIISYLDSLPNKKTGRVLGQASSMASVILSALDSVTALPTSEFFVHDVQGCACMCGSGDDYHKVGDHLNEATEELIRIYSRRVKNTDALRAYIKDQTTLSAVQVQELGLIDTIIEAKAMADNPTENHELDTIKAELQAANEKIAQLESINKAAQAGMVDADAIKAEAFEAGRKAAQTEMKANAEVAAKAAEVLGEFSAADTLEKTLDLAIIAMGGEVDALSFESKRVVFDAIASSRLKMKAEAEHDNITGDDETTNVAEFNLYAESAKKHG